ncbi:MAG: GNAT family N-acetyltransferase [Geminicoccaceae bacterium]
MTQAEWMARIEKASLFAWPPRETAAHCGWLLRGGGGHSRRLNSAATLAFEDAVGATLEDAVGHVERWYEERDAPPCFQLCDHARPAALDDFLARRGYAGLTETSVMTAAIDPGASAGHDVILEGRPTALVMNAIADPLWSPAVRAARAAVMNRIRRPLAFAVIAVDGVPRAGGLCVVDGELAGVFSVRSDPAFRRQGLARSLMARLTGWAHGMGAKSFYLQVENENAPALALYRSLGFETVYGYHYRQLGEGKA